MEERWKNVQQTEKCLRECLAEKEVYLRDITQFLTLYRNACEDVLLQDFELAVGKKVEDRLWDFHGKANNRFRKELKYFQDPSGRKKPVERRKSEKSYLDFIKSSQRFYRVYIQRLASRFGGIRELETIANRLTLSTLSADDPIQVSGSLGRTIFLSCHHTLVRLGDLSRWRETQLVFKDRNWGPAIGYYELACAIHPSSGASHNQLAVIALADANHLHATYHLYRALAVDEPHATAQSNLEVEFKKIQELWSRGEFQDDPESEQALVGRFLRLHALYYKGQDIAEHEELESEVLSQLSFGLRERSWESSFNKITLICLAAEYFAGNRDHGEPSCAEIKCSFFLLQRLNVRVFITLLQVLQPELEQLAKENVNDTGVKSSGSVKLTTIMRRVLPGLRQYSTWLTSRAKRLTAQVVSNLQKAQIQELWKIYASTLTVIASTFPIPELPSILYLLEEDEDTLGFKLFDNDETERRYYTEGTASLKPKWHDRGVEKHHPNTEMLGRIRDFLTDGMFLLQKGVPIQLLDRTFVYVENGVVPDPSSPSQPSAKINGEEVTHVSETILSNAPALVENEDSEAASASGSIDLSAKRMVDELVDSETADENIGDINLPSKAVGNETSYGLIGSATAREHFGDVQPQPQTSPRPLLPSILNSPFALQPGERTPDSRPSTGKRRTPGHSQQNSQTSVHIQPQPVVYQVDSSTANSSMPDPTFHSDHNDRFYHNQPFGNPGLPSTTGYAFGRNAFTSYGNDTAMGALLDDGTFMSSNIFSGSTWNGSAQSGRRAVNISTPPNGQRFG